METLRFSVPRSDAGTKVSQTDGENLSEQLSAARLRRSEIKPPERLPTPTGVPGVERGLGDLRRQPNALFGLSRSGMIVRFGGGAPARNLPAPSSAEVKEIVEYTSTPPLGFHSLFQGEL